ncbi:putative RNA polymerase sigma factor SigL [Streptomyces viridochromogenes Tue57]|uniref:Putative RNA polymerase sigma factor SigL n=1 Tax=Streptomyces viridochromogenes Tue57 TaxID=1160705 RepID=L8PQC3_STRVR|nr:putative RNA polymerase sigma factor SigL [Streptomyces viridochromogenes Tue57]
MAVWHRRRPLTGQSTHTDLRRTVDRVGERFDERSLPHPGARRTG